MSFSMHDYKILIFKDEEGDFIATLVEIPELSAFGNTPDEALKELEIAYELWLESVTSHNFPIPKPLSQKHFSGKLSIRIPKTLHEDLFLKSQEDGVSLNKEIIYRIQKGLNSIIQQA